MYWKDLDQIPIIEHWKDIHLANFVLYELSYVEN